MKIEAIFETKVADEISVGTELEIRTLFGLYKLHVTEIDGGKGLRYERAHDCVPASA